MFLDDEAPGKASNQADGPLRCAYRKSPSI